MERQVVDKKRLRASKTCWAALAIGILPALPVIGPVITPIVSANPALFCSAVGALFYGLRLATKAPVR